MRWRARRGMLEVDAILQTYLGHAIFATPAARQRFEALLDYGDDQLYRWLFAIEVPADNELAQYLDDMRLFVQQHGIDEGL